MNTVQISGPASEPVSLADAKLFLRVENSLEDDLISLLITAARQHAERYTGRTIGAQTFDTYYDSLEDDVDLPRGPLTAVAGVYYTDTAGVETLWPSSAYYIDLAGGRICPLDGWPTAREYAGYRVRYTAGYATVPEGIRAAILRIVSDLYEHRQDVMSRSISYELPMSAAVLLAPYRVWFT